ncbi:amino acid--ACP ligase [Paenibacillus sp. 598K]|uniref:aminoacyl--tRNA ligase-related protein n=1 Tax=Paenibacillus sp. 598K TaxID=1117987 RepID=UPI000FF93884|nr:aminoacyl--tRNA ligase-related protein [Paenibacillus sp. 598K]GBF75032.1 amino acid--ACP ligase [Paenibacillus sp. 598K]
MVFRYALHGRLNAAQAESLSFKLSYSYEQMSSCRYDESSHEVVVELDDPDHAPALATIVEKLIESSLKERQIGKRVICETEKMEANVLGSVQRPVFDGMRYEGAALAIFEAVDARLARLADGYASERRRYSASISLETMEKCNYVSYFPQNLYMISEIPHQYDALQQIKATGDYRQHARLGERALTPAVCFHCYEEFSDSIVDQPVVISSAGHCFRHEATWRKSSYRLKEFQMREIVYLGDEQTVSELRSAIMTEVWTLFCELGLTGRIETAADPFYYPQDNPMAFHQIMAEMKYELVAQTGDEQFSIASFNHVHDSLTRQFRITDRSRQPVHSGCVAFGVDRWVYLLLCEYGPDLDEWPDRVKHILAAGGVQDYAIQ